ncbi:hypothetical protein BDR04DRAFT_1061761 [Suillus decipiens]|nr:hypothetical protein BDR04DRAFT_1061761 [Suillus decipiens]
MSSQLSSKHFFSACLSILILCWASSIYISSNKHYIIKHYIRFSFSRFQSRSWPSCIIQALHCIRVLRRSTSSFIAICGFSYIYLICMAFCCSIGFIFVCY